MNYSLSTLIIAKNEADNIADTINSVKSISHEIVLIDSGSTDDTREVARNLGAKVYDFEWSDSFSEARNYGIEHCSADWILVIDADEVLDADSLRRGFKDISDETGGLNVKLINKLSGGKESTHRYTRIFRNIAQFRFTGRVHEQIRESIETSGYDVIETEIAIYHKGYFTESQKKMERNRRLLEMDLRDNPDDSFLLYHLANTEFSLKNHELATGLFVGAIQKGGLSRRQIDISNIRLAQMALAKEHLPLVEQLTDFESADEDLEGLRLFVLAAKYMLEGNYLAAYDIYSSSKLYKSAMIDRAAAEKALAALKQILGK